MSIKCSEGKPVHTPPQNYGLKMGIPQSFNKGFAVPDMYTLGREKVSFIFPYKISKS